MKKKTAIVVLIVAAGILVAAGLFFYLEEDKTIPAGVQTRQEEPLVRGELRKDRDQDQAIPQETPAVHDDGESARSEYLHYSNQLKSFCEYLDEQDYVGKYAVTEGTRARFLSAIGRLSEAPPLVMGETQDMTRLAANLYHFFRVLGKNDTLLAAEILARERDKTEVLAALVYRWLILDMEQPEPEAKTSLEALYHYGGFFLATLGGRSYLARRDSKTAFLVRCYSLFMVDLADRKMKNSLGIDIAVHLKAISRDMAFTGDLERLAIYEADLKEIEDRLVTR
ncbi:MAG: hypothetical protein M0Q23_01875 [Syntrophales bacterium]|jgi:hypothetical protein|nr:hypothetical protein [Syntrophales bacterium]MCK9527398.1 hypothetical protein [Syntrophales bacterium]MDX9921500.1 hypothetical protein [Syntrophales bacterium]